jgi:SAM-dependent methyltransferase
MASVVTTVDYYEVFEAALSELTAVRAEYRRHFGAHVVPSPAGYCWFKGVTAPERHPDFAKWLCDAGTELENRLLADMVRVKPQSMLDVGCGNGSLLRRLAAEYPGVALTGVNSQPTQVQTARGLLKGTPVEVVEADFLNHDFARRFDVAYLFESAFHMPDKAELCRRLANVLAPGGEAWLIDIVIAERAAETFQSMGKNALFNYVPRKQWQACFQARGFEELEFVDFSRGAAEVLQVSDIKLLEPEYFVPRLRQAMSRDGVPVAEGELQHALGLLVQIAVEYRRLARLLRGGMLQYVLMRYRKTGATAAG